MGKIKDKVFGLVVSKNVTDSLADSIKDNNQAKFYLAQDKLPNGQALDDVTSPDELTDRNVLIINGNKIQGVNQNDLSKLDCITDAGKLFKYKGSVETGDELLKKVPPEAEVGDVWNVEQECEIDGVEYPAYTNFVCSSVKTSLDNKPASSTWDSLGGTMQIGTSAIRRKESDSIIGWRTKNKIPLSEFEFMVNTDTGLYIDDNAKLALTISSGGIPTLYVSTDPVTSLVTYQSVISANHPLSSIAIQVSTGLQIKSDNKICLCLATGSNLGSASSNYSGAGVSGLDISRGGLYVVLSSSATINKKFLVNNGDGISLDYTELVNSLMTDTSLEIYIGSLIRDALKAQ